jgi:hypothetical protein
METNIPEVVDVTDIGIKSMDSAIVSELKKIRRSDIDYREYKKTLRPYINALKYQLETLKPKHPIIVITLEELGKLCGKYMKKVNDEDCENLGLAWAMKHEMKYIDAADIKNASIYLGENTTLENTTLAESIDITEIEPTVLANGFRYVLLEEEFWSVIVGLEGNCPLVIIEELE